MLKSFLILSLVLTSSFASAANEPFASCAGDHHGTYVEFKNGADGKVFIETSNDSDEPAEAWQIVKVTKSVTVVPKVGESWAIRQAIKAANAQDGSYDMVMVEAKRGDVTLYVQLNKWLNSENYLSVAGYVEELQCRL
jgi:hypothetical protein